MQNACHPYASFKYAAAFAPVFEPIPLKNTQSWVLKRNIPETTACDLMGCYPITVLPNLAGFADDCLNLKEQGFVSLVFVTDVCTQPEPDKISAFLDVCLPYKTHFLYDYKLPTPQFAYTRHHRYKIKQALNACADIRVVNLRDHLNGWQHCYNELQHRHNIAPNRQLSPSYFSALAEMEEIVAIGAFLQERCICMVLYISSGEYVYSHLTAALPEGYACHSAYAINDYAIDYFRNRGIACLDFGGAAGLTENHTDGLLLFKKGFANSTRRNMLCGKILAPDVYQKLTAARKHAAKDYFPAYRAF